LQDELTELKKMKEKGVPIRERVKKKGAKNTRFTRGETNFTFKEF